MDASARGVRGAAARGRHGLVTEEAVGSCRASIRMSTDFCAGIRAIVAGDVAPHPDVFARIAKKVGERVEDAFTVARPARRGRCSSGFDAATATRESERTADPTRRVRGPTAWPPRRRQGVSRRATGSTSAGSGGQGSVGWRAATSFRASAADSRVSDASRVRTSTLAATSSSRPLRASTTGRRGGDSRIRHRCRYGRMRSVTRSLPDVRKCRDGGGPHLGALIGDHSLDRREPPLRDLRFDVPECLQDTRRAPRRESW